MAQSYRVFRHELVTTLRRGGFLFLAFILPLLGLLGIGAYKILSRGGTVALPALETRPAEQTARPLAAGYVDASGLLHAPPSAFAGGAWLAFPDEAEAQAALEAGEISGYYLIPADFLVNGVVYAVYPQEESEPAPGAEAAIQEALLVNMLQGDAKLAALIRDPLELETASLEKPVDSRAATQGNPKGMARMVTPIFVVLFTMSLTTSSSLLLNGFQQEHENRTLEVLLGAISPSQLLAGKMLGLGTAGLLQALAWIGALFLARRLGGQVPSLPGGISLPPAIVAWMLLFYLGGFGIYASLMAGVGAMLPRTKENSTIYYVLIFPMMVSYMVGLMAALFGALHSPLVVGLSFFPLTAPVLMPARLLDGSLPAWQPLLSLGLVLLSAALILGGVAALFKVQYLLTGQPFSLRGALAQVRARRGR